MEGSVALDTLVKRLNIHPKDDVNLVGAAEVLNALLDYDNKHLDDILDACNRDDPILSDILCLLDQENNASNEWDVLVSNFINVVVKKSLGQKNGTCSHVIHRLCRRGYKTQVTNSIVDYIDFLCNVKDDYFNLNNFDFYNTLENVDTTMELCSSIMRRGGKKIYFKRGPQVVGIYVVHEVDYNRVLGAFSLVYSTCLNPDGNLNLHSLFNLFHPLSRFCQPLGVLFVIIEQVSIDCLCALASKLVTLWADEQVFMQCDNESKFTITGATCRALYWITKFHEKVEYSFVDHCIANVSHGVTASLGNVDADTRVCAMAMAMALDCFLTLTNEGGEMPAPLEFEETRDWLRASCFFCASISSFVTIGTDEILQAYNTRTGTPSENPYAIHLAVNEFECKPLETVSSLTKAHAEANILQKLQATQLEPDYLDQSWTKPPLHIIQCYERLAGTIPSAEIDSDALYSADLLRVPGESTEQKIMRITQTLIHLPTIIQKQEPILAQIAIPLSTILLRMDNLELYQEAITDLAKRADVKAGNEQGLHSPALVFEHMDSNVNFTTPEAFIYKSLAEICYIYPLMMTRHYSRHLLQNDYSQTQQVVMLLCIQYAFKKLRSQVSAPVQHPKCDLEPLVTHENSLDATDESFGVLKQQTHADWVAVDPYSIRVEALKCLMGAIKVYITGRDCVDTFDLQQTVLVGALETTTLLLGLLNHIPDEIKCDIKEMVTRLSKTECEPLRKLLNVLLQAVQ